MVVVGRDGRGVATDCLCRLDVNRLERSSIRGAIALRARAPLNCAGSHVAAAVPNDRTVPG